MVELGQWAFFSPHGRKDQFGDGGWPFKILLYHFCRMSSAVWPVLSSLSAPVLHLTNGNLLAFAPEACQPSSREGADGWQTTRRSGNAASLLFFFFPFPPTAGYFPDFYPVTAQRCPLNAFSSVYLFTLIDPISLKGISSEDFFFLLPCYSTPSRSTPPAHHSTVKQSAPSALPVGKHPPALHSRPVCWFLPVSPRGSLFLLMSVVSAHGAAPSQLNAAPPSQTSNQSKERSIPCCLMFIKAADICAASTSAAPQRLKHETTGFCNIRRETAGDGAERFFVCF